MRLAKPVQYLLFGLLTLVLLYFSFRGIRWEDFSRGLQNANWYWIAASVGIGFLSFYLRAWRWKILIDALGTPVKTSLAFDGVNIGYLTNFALPRAGEIARCGVISGSTPLGFNAVLGTVVIERGFDVLCLGGLTLLVCFLKKDLFGSFVYEQIWQPFAQSAAQASWGRWALGAGLLLALVLLCVLLRKHLARLPFRAKVAGFVRGLWQGVKDGLAMPRKYSFLCLSLALWASFLLTSWCTVQAFDLTRHSLGVDDALFLMIVGSLGWLVPVQGGFGAFHFIVSLALGAVYGIEQTQGLVFATISHEAQALAMLLAGGYSLLHLSLIKKQRSQTPTP